MFRETIQEGLPDGAPIEEVFNYLEVNYDDSAPCLIQIFQIAVTAGRVSSAYFRRLTE